MDFENGEESKAVEGDEQSVLSREEMQLGTIAPVDESDDVPTETVTDVEKSTPILDSQSKLSRNDVEPADEKSTHRDGSKRAGTVDLSKSTESAVPEQNGEARARTAIESGRMSETLISQKVVEKRNINETISKSSALPDVSDRIPSNCREDDVFGQVERASY